MPICKSSPGSWAISVSDEDGVVSNALKQRGSARIQGQRSGLEAWLAGRAIHIRP